MIIYRRLYQRHCKAAFAAIYTEACSHYFDKEVSRNCENLFEYLERGFIGAAQLHKRTAVRFATYFRQLRSNVICLCCLRRHPERHLSCGHSVCDTCVATFGIGIPRMEDKFKMYCLFDDGGELQVSLKPKTAGVRLMGVDGGGARGVTPLEFLGELQRHLGNCQLHEMIDLALGTSSGKSLYRVGCTDSKRVVK